MLKQEKGEKHSVMNMNRVQFAKGLTPVYE